MLLCSCASFRIHIHTICVCVCVYQSQSAGLHFVLLVWTKNQQFIRFGQCWNRVWKHIFVRHCMHLDRLVMTRNKLALLFVLNSILRWYIIHKSRNLCISIWSCYSQGLCCFFFFLFCVFRFSILTRKIDPFKHVKIQSIFNLFCFCFQSSLLIFLHSVNSIVHITLTATETTTTTTTPRKKWNCVVIVNYGDFVGSFCLRSSLT